MISVGQGIGGVSTPERHCRRHRLLSYARPSMEGSDWPGLRRYYCDATPVVNLFNCLTCVACGNCNVSEAQFSKSTERLLRNCEINTVCNQPEKADDSIPVNVLMHAGVTLLLIFKLIASLVFDIIEIIHSM